MKQFYLNTANTEKIKSTNVTTISYVKDETGDTTADLSATASQTDL